MLLQVTTIAQLVYKNYQMALAAFHDSDGDGVMDPAEAVVDAEPGGYLHDVLTASGKLLITTSLPPHYHLITTSVQPQYNLIAMNR